MHPGSAHVVVNAAHLVQAKVLATHHGADMFAGKFLFDERAGPINTVEVGGVQLTVNLDATLTQLVPQVGQLHAVRIVRALLDDLEKTERSEPIVVAFEP
jgi:hypothetical protein